MSTVGVLSLGNCFDSVVRCSGPDVEIGDHVQVSALYQSNIIIHFPQKELHQFNSRVTQSIDI